MQVAAETQREIEALLVRYATAADTRDMETLAGCFTEDVHADYGAGIGKFEGRAALIAQLQAMLGACGPTLHYVSNFVVAEDGEGLKSRCYTQAVVHVPGLETPVRTAGIYDDRLRRGEAGWQILARVYTPVA